MQTLVQYGHRRLPGQHGAVLLLGILVAVCASA